MDSTTDLDEPVTTTTISCTSPTWTLVVIMRPGTVELGGHPSLSAPPLRTAMPHDRWRQLLPIHPDGDWSSLGESIGIPELCPTHDLDRLRIWRSLWAIPVSEVGQWTASLEVLYSQDLTTEVRLKVLDGCSQRRRFANLEPMPQTHRGQVATLEQVREALQSAEEGDWAPLCQLAGPEVAAPPDARRPQICRDLWRDWRQARSRHQEWVAKTRPLEYMPATIRIPCVQLRAPGPRARLMDEMTQLDGMTQGTWGPEYDAVQRELARLSEAVRQLPVEEPETCLLSVHSLDAVRELADSQPGPRRQACYRRAFGVQQHELPEEQMLLLVQGRPYVVEEDAVVRAIDHLLRISGPGTTPV